jgi:hypothetical protein
MRHERFSGQSKVQYSVGGVRSGKGSLITLSELFGAVS